MPERSDGDNGVERRLAGTAEGGRVTAPAERSRLNSSGRKKKTLPKGTGIHSDQHVPTDHLLMRQAKEDEKLSYLSCCVEGKLRLSSPRKKLPGAHTAAPASTQNFGFPLHASRWLSSRAL